MSQKMFSLNFASFNWDNDAKVFVDYLYSIGDKKYKDFSKKITPGDFEMIGINIPILKKISKEILKGDYKSFLNIEYNHIFEVRMLKGLVISQIKDMSTYKRYFSWFLPQIDNWAICDIFLSSSKIIKEDKEYFLNKCRDLLLNRDEFLNRIAFVILLNYFMEEEYFDSIILLINGYRNDKYYANMAISWLLSVMCVKMPLEFKNNVASLNIDDTVKKMTLRKICDSYRVSDIDKEYYKKILK